MGQVWVCGQPSSCLWLNQRRRRSFFKLAADFTGQAGRLQLPIGALMFPTRYIRLIVGGATLAHSGGAVMHFPARGWRGARLELGQFRFSFSLPAGVQTAQQPAD